jgi:PleD family two-component response regulator
VHVTISIGLTLANSQSAPPEAIIEQADRALYRSKAEGRDTVRFATLSAA